MLNLEVSLHVYAASLSGPYTVDQSERSFVGLFWLNGLRVIPRDSTHECLKYNECKKTVSGLLASKVLANFKMCFKITVVTCLR